MAITTNFLKTNSVAGGVVGKAKDVQQALQEGKAKLEGMFPKQVQSSSEVHYEIVYVNVNGKNYGVIGYPTYRQNAEGTFDFVSMDLELIDNPDEFKKNPPSPSADKSKIEWYGQSLGNSGTIDRNGPGQSLSDSETIGPGWRSGQQPFGNSGTIDRHPGKPYIR